MTEGVDYSWARPNPSCLHSVGRTFAVRYVGTTASGKNLTPAETRQLRAAGLDLVAVYQTTAGFMADGASGSAAALRALNDAAHCGMPSNRPIYFALDMDPSSITPGGWLNVERFLTDAARVLGIERVGVYGGIGAIDRLVPEHAVYGWQTYAWSHGRVSPRANLYQYRNGVNLCGGMVDLCRSLAADFGQWNYVPLPPSIPTQEEDVKGIIVSPTDHQDEWKGAWLYCVGHYWSHVRTPFAAAFLRFIGQAVGQADGGPFPFTTDAIMQTWRLAPGTDDPRTLEDESLALDVAEVERQLTELHASVTIPHPL